MQGFFYTIGGPLPKRVQLKQVGFFSKVRANSLESNLQNISSNSSSWKRSSCSAVFKRDLEAANLQPYLEQGCGKQMPSASILFFRTNLVFVLNIEM